jgi:hypothetical protein
VLLQAPGMVRKLPNFVSTLFEALLHFLLDIEDDADWHRVSRGGGVCCINRSSVQLEVTCDPVQHSAAVWQA